MVPLKRGASLAVGLIPGRGKNAIEINLSLQEEISMKKSLQRHLWGENTDISAMLRANPKKTLKLQRNLIQTDHT